MPSKSRRSRTPPGVSPWPEKPGFEYKDYHCTAKSKQSGYRCTEPRYIPKDDAGRPSRVLPRTDKCYIHGGVVGKQRKHGMRSRFGLPPKLEELRAQYEHDPKLLDRRRWLSLLAVLVDEKIGHLHEGEPIPADVRAEVEPIIRQILRSVSDHERLVVARHLIHPQEAESWLGVVIDIMGKYVPDALLPEALGAVKQVIGGDGTEPGTPRDLH